MPEPEPPIEAPPWEIKIQFHGARLRSMSSMQLYMVHRVPFLSNSAHRNDSILYGPQPRKVLNLYWLTKQYAKAKEGTGKLNFQSFLDDLPSPNQSKCVGTKNFAKNLSDFLGNLGKYLIKGPRITLGAEILAIFAFLGIFRDSF